MMTTILKILLGVAILLVVASAVIWWLGSRLPRDHRVSRMILFPNTSAARLWEIISDQAAQPTWRRDIKANVRQPDRDGHEVWRNEARNGDALTIEIVESFPTKTLVTRIADDGPFGGQWTYEVQPTVTGSRLTITEAGWVGPAFMRALAYYVMGFHTTIEAFLNDLAKRLGENAKPERVQSLP